MCDPEKIISIQTACATIKNVPGPEKGGFLITLSFLSERR
jgi:hypothetical protein